MDDQKLPPDRMRASDADRDACAERLARGLQEGRLDLAEYQERLGLAMRAKVMGDLWPLTADLPEPPAVPEPAAEIPPAPGARAGQPEWRDRLEPWRGLAAISVILIGIWGVTSIIAAEPLLFWPMIPIGFMFLFTLAGAIAGTPTDRPGGDSRGP
ncbi:DUF1707 domain-containing protein [Streptomonospora nanhaiensis]|uniref:DUF1707 domain-containing protein n=1 Tax=Streptomonospora nanhaiensis TaxID=1323731 RepID=A0A853BU86_9ACTN|nr:DUF1707 domain-containing protein [Streptomonospora nanhaiensis]MBV2363639.1 DUF1707 domain-containing protein [Streptomonospora nanhaiensis]MBX9391095.1 DUF1707 domain-containing protein [Streptomonospora nanhaiensis]NYI98683.1 hypothetical protein [Streptomonospora nanhaiensis]